MDSMPINSSGGIWSTKLWSPKYASHVYKVNVAADMLGNMVWICPLAPRTSADFLIWDGYGPSRTRGDFFDFEVGGHDGAENGRIHVIVPFIGRKNGTLTARQHSYKDVHGWYRACIGHLFGQLWLWGLVRNIWRGACVFCCISRNFVLRGRSFTLVKDHRTMSRAMFGLIKGTHSLGEDALCCHKRFTIACCGECRERYCDECIGAHTCGEKIVS